MLILRENMLICAIKAITLIRLGEHISSQCKCTNALGEPGIQLTLARSERLGLSKEGTGPREATAHRKLD